MINYPMIVQWTSVLRPERTITMKHHSMTEGGRFDEIVLAPIIQRLAEAVRFSRGVGELKRDDGPRLL